MTALNYVAHNIVAGVPFISKVGTQAKNGKEALWGGLLGGILLGLCALALNFGMLTTYDQVYMLEVPGLEFAKMLNPVMGGIYAAILIIMIYNTIVPMMISVANLFVKDEKDPTSACNLHCTGCWAAEYGHKLNLSYDDIDSIIEQGKALGTHVFIYTGGEPLVRKHDLIKLCEAHPDCAFLCFTNATLIDEAFCQDMIRVANFVPAISAEGFEEATDARRGEGVFQKVSKAMALLREHGLPFGVSCCYTAQNASSIASEEYFDWLIDQGALFAWIFSFMPVGHGSTPDLIPNAAQREHLYNFVREMRQTKPLFTLDFQDDGEFVGGCIAGGRRYLHINAAGDVEPCVFAHYSNANIHDVSLLDALRSPIFMEYYYEQPFDGNYLRPCPILENSGMLADMVARSGAKSTDLQHEETAEELCSKTKAFSEEWAPVAKRLWNDPRDPMHGKRMTKTQGMAEADMRKFERLQKEGRTLHYNGGLRS